ncbi:MAG: hypothetical protein Q9212_000446 [Teloschistes hypoglaucus]
METEANPELQHVRNYWATMKPNSPIYNFLLGDIEIMSATKGQIQAQLRVRKVHVNSKGTLHGVTSSCIMDWAGGLTIASTGLKNSGVSTDIHTSYVSTAKEGDLIEVNAKVNKVGSTMAFTIIEIRRAGDGGKVVAHGTHTKYIKQ